MKKKDIWISLAIIACSGLSVLYYTQRKGYVRIDAGRADALLQLKSIGFINTTINSGMKPSAIAARVYRPQFLGLSMKQDGQTWRMESRGPWGDISKVKVRNDEATALKLGPPFVIKPQIRKNRPQLYISFAIIGQAGEQYRNFITKNDRVVAGAIIKIIDDTGNVLESGKFKYG
jgi:hypothetical protein